MEIIDCIKTRRSKRKYLDKKIPVEVIKKIIDLFNTITHNELRYSTTIAPTNMILKSLIDNTKIRRTLEFNIENPQSALSGYIKEATSHSP